MYDMVGGYVLLCSKLGIAGRKPLTHAQFHKFLSLGVDVPTAAGMKNCPKALPGLIEDAAAMGRYVKNARDIVPIILSDERYPQLVKQRLGEEAPGLLWAKGNLALLNKPTLAVVGSRDLSPEGAEFARTIGTLAAKQGYVLVSGNAAGTDSIAQDACLAAGGCVISVVADRLTDKQPHDRILYLSEDDYDQGFSGARALSRNNIIHSMGAMTYVAQSAVFRSGTYSGTMRNLKNRWSPVIMHSDGSTAAEHFAQLGATLVELQKLRGM